MDVESKLRKEHADILTSQTLMTPDGNATHCVIKFNLYLQRQFPNQDKFIHQDLIEVLYQKMVDKYNNGIRNNDNTYFKTAGTLETISIDTLRFYQPTVGICGPYHSDIDEPVLIIKDKRDFILYNGYHRVLTKIVKEVKNIQGFVLSVDS